MAGDLLSTPPPLAPPMTQGEKVSWLRLIRSHRVGVSTFFRLMSEHGTASAALDALPGIATAAGVSKYTSCTVEAAEDEMARGVKLGARLIFYGSPDYPTMLAQISDPPPVLWTFGDTALLHREVISVIGARNASSLGRRMAKFISHGLGNMGFVVGSGLARGIDAAAHSSALETGTIAVQAGGVDRIYPSETAELHDQIAKAGLRISEQPVGLQPQSRHFPRRNRIISGLSRAVVVIEAAAKSGSLITARNALDQGREVLVVPGHPLDARSAGCNMLIRDGATLVRDAQDVKDALSPLAVEQEPYSEPQDRAADPSESEPPPSVTGDILQLLGPTPVAEDQLIRDLARPAHLVTPQIVELELQGRIMRQPGGLLSRAD
ncbi:MAG: DNA-processing protein DprA [Pseudomonadota bacterium]